MEHNRDLLYVARTAAGSALPGEYEIEYLHRMLSTVETMGRLCTCSEIIDLTLFSVITAPHLVKSVLRQHELKPFQFICNKN